MTNKYFLSILLFTFSIQLNAHDFIRGVAILDLTERNGETNNAHLISTNHIIDVVGVSRITTSDVNVAINHSMILCTSKVSSTTFTSTEEAVLADFINSGGTLVVPRMEDSDMFNIFGLESLEASNSRHQITWDLTANSSALEWINEPEEQTISLGRLDGGDIFKTIGYLTSTANSLAMFEDESSAITINSYGAGNAVAIGVSWKDIILRNQINRDYEAQRLFSNGFEPSSDVMMLFIRGLFIEQNPFAVWKNTSPNNTKSVLMVTHDVDSKTAMDSLSIFVDFELSKQIEATYNITLKYFEDAMSSAFYDNHQQELEYVLENGHQIQSHSVGHFFDFADDDIISKGGIGNTKENYTPYNDGDETNGATVYGECEVSKNELESDFGINIRTFRSGHLAYPKDLVEVLEALDYEYNSSNSACDVLTNFPYQNVIGKSFSGRLSSVYEIPVTISDVFSNDPISAENYKLKAEIWMEATLKNFDNGAPTVLLIHPNRKYKLDCMQYFLNGLQEPRIKVMEIGKFGDFWKARKGQRFESTIESNSVEITLPNMVTEGVSFVVDNGQNLNEIVVKNANGEILNFNQSNLEDDDIIIYLVDDITSASSEKIQESGINIYPNPTDNNINIEVVNEYSNLAKLFIYDLNGKVVFSVDSVVLKNNRIITLDLDSVGLPSGIYSVVIENIDGAQFAKRIVLY